MILFHNRFVRWNLFYLYQIFLVLLAVLPINGSANSTLNHVFVVTIRLDYFLHCLVYIPLVTFAWIDKKMSLSRFSIEIILWIFGLLLFAFATEGIQYLLPYRAFNINDLLANGLGIIIGFVIIMVFVKMQISTPVETD